jgi:predicted DNA binding CopG/RHH family protein
MKKAPDKVENLADAYDREGILGQIEEEPIEFALDEELREQIVKGTRRRRLRNVSIKLDAAQIVALKRIATQKAMPYQTLIRSWLAEGLRRELFHPR